MIKRDTNKKTAGRVFWGCIEEEVGVNRRFLLLIKTTGW